MYIFGVELTQKYICFTENNGQFLHFTLTPVRDEAVVWGLESENLFFSKIVQFSAKRASKGWISRLGINSHFSAIQERKITVFDFGEGGWGSCPQTELHVSSFANFLTAHILN